jgi:L-alanine-DL-glutamate epimerase-like enolase superfamily enzyme
MPGRSAGARPASELYGELLSTSFGAPRLRLPVQHVVGLADPLEEGFEPPGDSGGNAERSLRDWAGTDRFRHVEVKLGGADPAADAYRVTEVHRVLREVVGDDGITVALDANEGYREPDGAVDLLDRLASDSQDARRAIVYLEQPVPRGTVDPEGLRSPARRVPLLVDEGLATRHDLAELPGPGWTGLVVKAAKGQSLSLLSWAHARRHGLQVMVQDLTAVGPALAHSARPASMLPQNWPAFEYNSRQYAPAANRELADRRPELVTVRDGHVVAGPPGPGIAEQPRRQPCPSKCPTCLISGRFARPIFDTDSVHLNSRTPWKAPRRAYWR